MVDEPECEPEGESHCMRLNLCHSAATEAAIAAKAAEADANANVVEGLKRGAVLICSAPSYYAEGAGQICCIFELARDFGLDIDFHLDVGPSADDMDIYLVSEFSEKIG